MKLCCFVSALAFVVLLYQTASFYNIYFINIVIVVINSLHVHNYLIWCEIYILAHLGWRRINI
jgi:hypothetical protein